MLTLAGSETTELGKRKNSNDVDVELYGNRESAMSPTREKVQKLGRRRLKVMVMLAFLVFAMILVSVLHMFFTDPLLLHASDGKILVDWQPQRQHLVSMRGSQTNARSFQSDALLWGFSPHVALALPMVLLSAFDFLFMPRKVVPIGVFGTTLRGRGPLWAVGRSYAWMLRRFPWFTGMVQGGLIYAVGDSIMQAFESFRAHETGFDLYRMGSAAELGALLQGILLKCGYQLIERLLPQTGHRMVATKAGLSLSTVTPALITGNLLGRKLLSGYPWGIALVALTRDFLPTWGKGCVIWLPYNVIAFSLIPLEFRPLCTGLVSLAWSVIMSGIASSQIDDLPVQVMLPATQPPVLRVMG